MKRDGRGGPPPRPREAGATSAGAGTTALNDAPASAPANKTVIVPVQPAKGGLATAQAAGEDLARVPLPEGWEISLDFLEGPDGDRSFRVTRSRVLIGRGAVDVALTDQLVSRRHVSLEVYGSTCVLVKDLDSTNGTFVNGRRVTTTQVQDGDEVKLGDTRFVISIGAPP